MKALEYLPPHLARAATGLNKIAEHVCEIRLRRDQPLAFSVYDGTVFVNADGRACKISAAVVCTNDDIKYVVNRLCAGSVYRYADTLRRGYIVTPDGLRAGVYGEAIYENGKICALDSYIGVNLRVPHVYSDVAAPLLRDFAQNGLRSTLVFSSPGVGKTTFIRALSVKLSHKYRVAVVDEKGEILPPAMCCDCGMCDVLRGYSKPDGMEIAMRTLSPQVIVCDEVGMNDDIPAILSLQNGGAVLIATAHGANLERIMLKPNIRALCDALVFERFVRLEKAHDGVKTILENGG